MRQKMAIARGLLAEPEIVFMDEPTRALDPISAREVRDLVAEYLGRRTREDSPPRDPLTRGGRGVVRRRRSSRPAG